MVQDGMIPIDALQQAQASRKGSIGQEDALAAVAILQLTIGRITVLHALAAKSAI